MHPVLKVTLNAMRNVIIGALVLALAVAATYGLAQLNVRYILAALVVVGILLVAVLLMISGGVFDASLQLEQWRVQQRKDDVAQIYGPR